MPIIVRSKVQSGERAPVRAREILYTVKLVKVFVLGAIICVTIGEIVQYMVDHTVEPKSVEYEEIAFDLPDKAPSVFRKIDSILPICGGQDQERCRQQAKEGLRARNMPVALDANYSLFINTQYKNTSAAVVVTLFNKYDQKVWQRSASIKAPPTAERRPATCGPPWCGLSRPNGLNPIGSLARP